MGQLQGPCVRDRVAEPRQKVAEAQWTSKLTRQEPESEIKGPRNRFQYIGREVRRVHCPEAEWRLTDSLTNPKSSRDLIHLYLHIPFCRDICPYCAFYKHKPGETDMGYFVDGILREAKLRSASINTPKIDTVYLGGGTPSMLSPDLIHKLFDGLGDIFRLAPDTEINLEANPATFGRSAAKTFAQSGVTRVSLGAQSFSPDVLKTLGRTHGPREIGRSVDLLRAASIENVSIDLMFSIPGQTLDQWRESLESALELSPNHISAYNLTYEEDTPFFTQFREGLYTEIEETNASMFELAHELLTSRGLRHYETSNYAYPGYESRHNKGYWRGSDYLGLGPSAVSTISGRRWKNIPDTAQYLVQIGKGGSTESEVETLTPAQLDLERIALMLRTDAGVHRQHLSEVPSNRIEAIVSERLANWKGEHLVLQGHGTMLVDSIVDHLVS